MSVLIKGFEKPDHCLRCPVKGIDDECLLQSEAANADYESWEDQMAKCPLVAVPPHGRLVEDIAVIEQIDEWLNSVGTVMVGHGLSYYGELLGCIEDAPTIIEAEEKPNGRAQM